MKLAKVHESRIPRMGTRGRFQLHLPGLLKVLAEHLYSTQRVGIRELIQNAHDSCVRRAIERPQPGYRPRIDLTVAPKSRTLRVADNGSGLTEEEIHTYLTVIGRGYTRELRDRLAADDPAMSRELVGQFGIGFLSAFLLASEVTVETRSAEGPALRWFSAGDEEFDLTAGDRAETGTTVELRLKPSALFLLHEQNLIDVVAEYADFLPTPIHVQGSDAAANLGTPPWDEPDADEACRRYVQRRFDEREPLWLLRLADGTIDLGHDTLKRAAPRLPLRARGIRGIDQGVRRRCGLHSRDGDLQRRQGPAAAVGPLCPRGDRLLRAAADGLAGGRAPG